MENKKGTTVLLTVIGIATLLVAVVGATFAYFTASVTPTGNNANVTIQTATLGNVTFNQGDVVALSADNAYPGASSSKTFSVQAAKGTVNYNYSVYMTVTSDFVSNGNENNTNMEYQLCQVTDSETCTTANGSWTPIKTTDTTITLVDNKEMVVSESEPVTHSYNLFIRLKETESEQNYDQGKSFVGALKVEVANLDENTGYTTDTDGSQITTNIGS